MKKKSNNNRPTFTGEWDVIEDDSIKSEDIRYQLIINRQLYVCSTLMSSLSQPGIIQVFCDSVSTLETLLSPYWTKAYIKKKKELESRVFPNINNAFTKEENYKLFDYQKAERIQGIVENFLKTREKERLIELIRLMDVRNLLLQETGEAVIDAENLLE